MQGHNDNQLHCNMVLYLQRKTKYLLPHAISWVKLSWTCTMQWENAVRINTGTSVVSKNVFMFINKADNLSPTVSTFNVTTYLQTQKNKVEV